MNNYTLVRTSTKWFVISYCGLIDKPHLIQWTHASSMCLPKQYTTVDLDPRVLLGHTSRMLT